LAFAAGERKAASRSGLLSEKGLADAHPSVDPRLGKTSRGERRAYVTPFPNAKFWPCMPAGNELFDGSLGTQEDKGFERDSENRLQRKLWE